MVRINSALLAGAGAIGLQVAETLYKYDAGCVSILAKGERLSATGKMASHCKRREAQFPLQ
jgi:hypothetical protein